MKLSLTILLLIGLGASSSAGLLPGAAPSSCTISPDVNGGPGTTTVFTLRPKPLDLLTQLGASPDNKSPVAILNLLQSFSNQTDAIIRKLTGLANGALKPFFGTNVIPTCRWYWIENQMFCDDVPSLAIPLLCGSFNFISNVTVPINIPLPIPNNPLTNLTCEADDGTTTWGLQKIQAPQAWAQNWKGQGIVIANIDTGVRGTHIELRDNMRSTYNWYDPYKVSPSTPTDGHGHGTHTMGTMCGKTVGIAPSATWIACRGCNGPTASCGNEQLLACGQWVACPDNKALNCSTRPHVINNSWGGGVGDTSYFGVLATWKALGIASFFSSGNSGGNGLPCGTVVSPADADYIANGFLSVGSSQCDEAISTFSSTGPSQAADYMGGLAVQIVGPGTNVRSSWPTADDAYHTASGTSMSSPHATGSAAAVLSSRSGLTPAKLYQALMTSAYKRSDITSSALYCSGNNNNQGYPNNVYGFGRVNVFEACKAAAVL